ncbi:MAG: glycosyltransferase family 2 protein [Bacteroidota bacterium]
MDAGQSWSVIIFAYNESEGIGGTIKKTLSVLPSLTQNDWEIIVVDDGSIDETNRIAQNAAEGHPQIRIIRHEKNLGIGKALLTGYKAAKYRNVCAIPGDGQFDPKELIPFAQIPENTVVSFYRRKKIRYSLFRKTLSLGNRIYNRYLLGIRIRDVNWVKVYQHNMLQNIPSVLNSSLVESEMCAKIIHKGLEIIETPSVYNDRSGGSSKGASAKILLQAIIEMPALFFEVKRYRRKNCLPK